MDYNQIWGNCDSGAADDALNMMGKLQAADPNYPLAVPIQVLRKLLAQVQVWNSSLWP